MTRVPIYLDNAATTWPKPEPVARAVEQALRKNWGNPGRGSHWMAMNANRMVYSVRRKLAENLGVAHAQDVFFAQNATMALNLILQGAIQPQEHVLTTMFEHHAVWRVLYALQKKGVCVDTVSIDQNGFFDEQRWTQKLRATTKWIVINHASNVLGTIAPLKDIVSFAKKNGLYVIVDGSQTVGYLPISWGGLSVDAVAFSGHKALYGPMGIGGAYVAPHVEVRPVLYGGTGGGAERSEQPEQRPDFFETGTGNVPGIAGLGAALDWAQRLENHQHRQHEEKLTQLAIERLQRIKGVHVLGPEQNVARAPLVSFVHDRVDSAMIAHQLDRQYHIAVRAGLHCAPEAHRLAGTVQQGAVRMSFGLFTKTAWVHQAMDAIEALVTRR